jgi:hypothetical protein
MPVVVKFPVIPNEETPAPVQATEDILMAKAKNMIDTKMVDMIKAFEASLLQLSKANMPRYGGYQTARVYAIKAIHPPRHTPMNCSSLNAHTGPAYY